MYSNRRRSHIHFIHQYENSTNRYTGTRIVIFRKDKGLKEIKDIGDFRIHKYENPKSKNNKESKWEIKESILNNIIKKQMINESIDKRYKMIHRLYESSNINLENYLDEIINVELNSTN
jgi:hypothetical protein